MARVKRRRKVVKKRIVKARKRPGRVAGASRATSVPAIISNMTSARGDLVGQRNALDKQISALDRALAAMGSVPKKRRKVRRPAAKRVVAKRPAGRRARVGRRRVGSLKDQIASVFSGRKSAMAVKDVTAAVLASGYKTKNKTLSKSVGIALTQMPEMVKIGRGLFRRK